MITSPIYVEVQQINPRARFALLALTITSVSLQLSANLFYLVINPFFLLTGLLFAILYIAAITLKFTTSVYTDRIDVRFWPFFHDTIDCSEILSITERAFSIIGFGVRYDLDRAITYYKATGKRGLQLTLKNQQKVIIGSRKVTELKAKLII